MSKFLLNLCSGKDWTQCLVPVISMDPVGGRVKTGGQSKLDTEHNLSYFCLAAVIICIYFH